MDRLIKKARSFKYHSFQYSTPGEGARIFETETYILTGEKDEERIKLFWAADTLEDLINGLEKASKSYHGEELYIEFIPPEFVKSLEEVGYKIVSEWIDFWIEELDQKKWDFLSKVEIDLMKEDEISKVAAITRSCRGVSREFKGETDEFIEEWSQNTNNQAFVAKINNQPVGVCMMNLYDSPKGMVAFLRELAVSPGYQHQGIGRSLVKVGLEWGQKNNAARSFLMTDVENIHAINLYEKFGYKRRKGRGQINMARMV